MSDALFELYDIAEKHGAPHQAFEKWAAKHYTPVKNDLANANKLIMQIGSLLADRIMDCVE